MELGEMVVLDQRVDIDNPGLGGGGGGGGGAVYFRKHAHTYL